MISKAFVSLVATKIGDFLSIAALTGVSSNRCPFFFSLVLAGGATRSSSRASALSE